MVSTWRNRFASGLGACVLICIGLLGPLAGAARADGTGLTWPSDPVHLTQKGSAFIGSFTVFNPSGAKVLVSIPTTSAPCHMMLQTGTSVPVDPYSGAVVAVTTTDKCSAGDAADLQFDAHAATSAADGSKFDDKQLNTQAQPDWHKLALLFAGGAGIALVATLIGFALAKGTRQHFTWYVKVDSGVPTSWTTNLTALGALFSGFFVTTGLLKNILGTDPTAQLGFIAVGAALGVVLSGAAGLVTGAPTGGTASPRVWQFLLGSLLTAAGALGQVGVVAVAVNQLHIGLASTLIWVCAGLAAALLFIYLIASVKFYIDRYAVPPPTPVAAAGGAAPAVAPPVAPPGAPPGAAPGAPTPAPPTGPAAPTITRATMSRITDPYDSILQSVLDTFSATTRRQLVTGLVEHAEAAGEVPVWLDQEQTQAKAHEHAVRSSLPDDLQHRDTEQLVQVVQQAAGSESISPATSDVSVAGPWRKATAYLL